MGDTELGSVYSKISLPVWFMRNEVLEPSYDGQYRALKADGNFHLTQHACFLSIYASNFNRSSITSIFLSKIW